jgi:hypothetical protein
VHRSWHWFDSALQHHQEYSGADPTSPGDALVSEQGDKPNHKQQILLLPHSAPDAINSHASDSLLVGHQGLLSRMFGGGGSPSDKMAHTVLSEEPTWRAAFARLGEREVLMAGTTGRLNHLPAFASAPQR